MIRGTIVSTLLSEVQIATAVARLGEEISRDYRGKDLLCICLLKGSMVFLSDLIRRIDIPLHVDVMRASSYGDALVSSGSVKILQDLDQDISGREVLMVEDIVDTGRTLAKTLELLRFRQPRSLKVCALLDKPSRREVPIEIHYRGFEIENHFVVGYGLDFDEYYRNLPSIGVLEL